MSLISASLKRPITIIVIVSAVLFGSFLAIRTIPIDIFPKLNLPVIYVIEPYGGMTPQQMEGFFSTRLQDQFLYVNGIKNITSKSIQGITIFMYVSHSLPGCTATGNEDCHTIVYLNYSCLAVLPPRADVPQAMTNVTPSSCTSTTRANCA